MTPFELVKSRLDGLGLRWQQNGSAQSIKACCPAHEDRTPSLSVREGDDGTVLLNCFARCPSEAIVQAMGLEMRDLFPESSNVPVRRPARTDNRPKVHETRDDAISAAVWSVNQDDPSAKLVESYEYQGANGGVVLVVVRIATKDGKTFRQVSPVDGGWIVGGIKNRPLYRLPSILRASADTWVFVVEGERDVATCERLGVLATTSKDPSGTDWSPLAGRRVCLLPDNDEAGSKYADAVADKLLRLDPPAMVKRVELKGLPPKGDVTAWVELGPQRIVADEVLGHELVELADAAADVVLKAAEPVKAKADGPSRPFPVVESFASIEPVQVDWLWQDRIPLGRVSLLAGDQGLGKSFLTCDMASRISTGTPWPDGSPCERGSVLFVTAEDDPGDTIRPRLDAHYADVARVFFLRGFRETAEGEDQFFQLRHLDVLAETVRSIPELRLVVIDPIGSFIGGTDSYKDAEVRSVLAPVAKLAMELDVAFLMVAHTRKAASAKADDLVLGSRAFTALSRAVWHLRSDQQDKERRLLVPGKSNLARRASGLAYTIAGEPARLRWEDGPVDLSADEAIAAETDEDGGGALREAVEWLADFLAAGPCEAGKIRKASKAVGVSDATLRRAKSRLRVASYKCAFEGGWVWGLPTGEGAQGAHQPQDVERLGDY